MQAIFHSAQAWEQILKFVLHTNQVPRPGLLNCLAFQKLKVGNKGGREAGVGKGGREREKDIKNQEKWGKYMSAGYSRFNRVCPLSFHPWIMVSYFSQIKITETCFRARGPQIKRVTQIPYSLLPPPPIFSTCSYWGKAAESDKQNLLLP